MSHPIFDPDSWPKLLSEGDSGAAVAAWQAVLEADDNDITDKVGTFGDSTHNASLAWQRSRGIMVDGLIGLGTRDALNKPRLKGMPNLPIAGLEEIPYIEAVNWSKHLAPRTVVDLVVLHCMEGAEASTKAERVAAWMAGKNPRFEAPRSSAHYFVDDDSIVCGVREDGIAWHAPGANRTGIGIEHAGRARQTRAQWLDDFGTPMLQRSARLTSGIASRWDIPIQFVDREALRAGKESGVPARGFTTHNEVTKAFRKSTHTDPGEGFPIDWYLDRVRAKSES